MNNEKLFFFLLDYKKTKQAIAAQIDDYNKNLELLFERNQDEFRKNRGLRQNQTYKACTIKSCEETTLFALMQIYGGWLHRNSYTGLQPEAFRTNNAAIATQKNNHISTRTAMRHIFALKEAGIITEKIFRGTKASYELKFNPNLIHFKPNSEYNFYLVELYKSMIGQREVKPQAFKLIYSFSPTLANFPLGYQGTSCRLNSTSIILLVHKINMESGIVSYDFRLRTSPSSENHTNNNFFDFDKNRESQNMCQTEDTPQVAPPPPPASDLPQADPLNLKEDIKRNKQLNGLINTAQTHKDKGTQPVSEHDKLWKEVLTFYCYATAILYPERIITDYERNRVCSEIYKHFKNKINDKPVYPTVYNFRGEFMFRILLTKKYLKKNPMAFLPGPTNYFDFENKHGFNGTTAWVEPSKEMEKQNKLYLEHYKKFIQAWKDYTLNPNVSAYNLAIQQLGKLKNDCWKNYFNQGVANLTHLSSSGASQIWKQHYQTN